jgi:hypothetical protein
VLMNKFLVGAAVYPINRSTIISPYILTYAQNGIALAD